MTFAFETYYDDIAVPTEQDEKDYRRFPVSFAHLVQMEAHAGKPSYAVRVRNTDRTLGLIYGPSADYFEMRGKLDYVRMNMSFRRLVSVPRAHGITMSVLDRLWRNGAEPAFCRERYHTDPLVPADSDEGDFRRFPISYAHLVQFEGADGETLYTVRCRNTQGKLKSLYEPTPDLAEIRAELEYVQVDFMVRRTMAAPYAHDTTVVLVNAFWRDRRIADEAAADAGPAAPRPG